MELELELEIKNMKTKMEAGLKDIHFKFIYQQEINEAHKTQIAALKELILFDKITACLKEFVERLYTKYKLSYFLNEDSETTIKNKTFILYKILKYEITDSLRERIQKDGLLEVFLEQCQDAEHYVFDATASSGDVAAIRTYWSILDLNKYFENRLCDDVAFYCVNFNDESRKTKMMTRFAHFNFELKFVAPVYNTDSRFDPVPEKFDRRTWSIMLQHLDSIKDFIETTDKNYLILCEDDILLSKNFKNDLPEFILSMKELKLDVLLLGYLMDFRFERKMATYPKIDDCSYCYYNDFPVRKAAGAGSKYLYCDYHYSLWGSQMYLIHRDHAKFLLAKYTIEYGINNTQSHFNPDWTLTKDGCKALIHPLVALEEGTSKIGGDSQLTFHNKCYQYHWVEDAFI